MNENLYAPPKANLDMPPSAGPAPALWNPDAAGAWSLLFSPVFGSTLVLKNWKAIGDPERVRVARHWLIASVLMLIPTLFLRQLGFIWIVVWYFASQRKQTRFVRETWGKDYPRRGWLVPLLCGFGVILAIWALVALVVVATSRS